MAQKKKSKKVASKAPKLPKVEKELKDFIVDEQGKMTRKDVAKLGVSLAVLGMMMQPGSADAAHTNVVSVHNPVDNCATHTNVTSHSNHSNHSDGGWMC